MTAGAFLLLAVVIAVLFAAVMALPSVLDRLSVAAGFGVGAVIFVLLVVMSQIIRAMAAGGW